MATNSKAANSRWNRVAADQLPPASVAAAVADVPADAQAAADPADGQAATDAGALAEDVSRQRALTTMPTLIGPRFLNHPFLRSRRGRLSDIFGGDN